MSGYRITNIATIILIAVCVAIHFAVGLSWMWYGLIIACYLGVCAYGSFVLSAQFFTPVTGHGQRGVNKIALTFDDGPVPQHTERILEILDRYKIKASFFCIGNRVAQHPHLVKQAYERGHSLGNHTYHHARSMGFSSKENVVSELSATDREIENVIGRKPRFFRPPFGVTNPTIAKVLKEGNYLTVGWSVRSFDTVITDPEKLFVRVTRSLKGGDIILFHDFCESTIRMLPRFIEHAQQNGLVFVSLEELLNEKPYR